LIPYQNYIIFNFKIFVFSKLRNPINAETLKEKKIELDNVRKCIKSTIFKHFNAVCGSHSLNEDSIHQLFSLGLFMKEHTVWEIGFGEGILAIILAYYTDEVIATDIMDEVFNQVYILFHAKNNKKLAFRIVDGN